MPRLRVTLIATMEYDADAAAYPTRDPQRMLAIDVDSFSEYPADVLLDQDVKIEVSGRVVDL